MRVPKTQAVLLLAAALACAGAPRIEVVTGATREFAPRDRFAPAPLGVLGSENPDFEQPELESLQDVLARAIGWRGLVSAPEDAADWWASCAFRKRLVWKGDLTREPVTQPWRPARARVLGASRTEYQTRGAVDPSVPQIEPWVETIVELRLRSRRTGTIGWSAARIWGRNRTDLPEDELKQTLELLLGQVRFQGDPPAAAAR
jgi:hypothetical protein